MCAFGSCAGAGNPSILFSLLFPLSPRLTTFLANLAFISLLLLFPSCVGNQKSVPALLHQVVFLLLLARFSGYSQNIQIIPFSCSQKLIVSSRRRSQPRRAAGELSRRLAALLQASNLQQLRTGSLKSGPKPS